MEGRAWVPDRGQRRVVDDMPRGWVPMVVDGIVGSRQGRDGEAAAVCRRLIGEYLGKAA